jgi:anti-sigma factor RsiW
VTRRLDERLSAYLDGELGERERAELEARLRGDPEGARQLDALRALERGLAELERIEPDPAFAARFRVRLERELEAGRRPWWQRVREGLRSRGVLVGAGSLATAAAALALALWLGRSEPLDPDLEQLAEIDDPEAWDLLRSGDVELLEVLEILEAWDGPQES